MSSPHNTPLLVIESLSISVHRQAGSVLILNNINLMVQRSEVIAVVGESGSGKTTLLRSIPRLLDERQYGFSGRILFQDTPVLELGVEAMRSLRRAEIRSVFQEPAAALNPLMTIGAHASTAGLTRDEFIASLSAMRFETPERIIRLYPHELSTGMLQRVLMALATSGAPSLILADEPTSAVDEELQHGLLRLLIDRSAANNGALLFSTHNLELARAFATRIVVMLNGSIVEDSPAERVFQNPSHSYTRLLVSAGTGER